MKPLFSALAIVAIALALLSPAPTQAQARQPYSSLSVSLSCGRDYVSYYCTAYPSGGSGSYTYNWQWYGPWYSYTSGNTILVYPPSGCSSTQYALAIVVHDSAGASGSNYRYLSC